jgi:hypothetical protein|tara:strand:+ start:1025 stop:1393 length:369 start_codon:yes stop_codon:yes gene_type:complete
MYQVEFFKFIKQGVPAFIVYFHIKLFSHMQARNGKWLPDKKDPSWVRLTNKDCKMDAKSKSKAIKKLEAAGLILVRRDPKHPKRTALLKIKNEVGPPKIRKVSELKFGGGSKREFKIERTKK